MTLARRVATHHAGGSFSPLDLTPIVWFDASDTGSVTTSGSNVTQWSDLSGNSRHATPGSSPTYVSSIQNGLSVVRYTATTQTLNVASFPNTSQPYSTMVAIRVTDASTAYRSYFGAANQFDMFTQTDTHRINATSNLIGAASAATNPYIVTGVYNGASSAIYVNGGAATTGSPGTRATGTAVYIGRATNAFVGDICEIVVVSGSIGTTDREALRGYLNTKWAIY